MTSKNWTRASIIFELKKRGTTLAAVATDAGLSRFTFYSAIERPYPHVHGLIAAALDLPVQSVWPEYYDDRGNRVSENERQRRAFQAQRKRKVA